MLLCDQCNRGFHLECLKLKAIPAGQWFCSACLNQLSEHGTHQLAPDTQRQQLPSNSSPLAAPPLSNTAISSNFWDPNLAQKLHGIRITKTFPDFPGQVYSGLVKYLGPKARPYAFRVHYDDGDKETMTLSELLAFAPHLSSTRPSDEVSA
jgi:hypothetical protein